MKTKLLPTDVLNVVKRTRPVYRPRWLKSTNWLDKAKLNAELDRTGCFYERYPYYYVEYGLTWIVADEMKKIVAKAAPGLEFVAHHALAVDGHQDIFVYRRT